MQVADAESLPALPEVARRILSCGAKTFETIFRVDEIPIGPGKIFPKETVDVAHGMAASAAAARLGASATPFSRLGQDDHGRRICDDLAAAGVDCSGVRLFPGIGSSPCTVIVDGGRPVVPFFDARLPDDPGWLPMELVENADAVQVDVRWPKGAAWLDAARNSSIPAILDADTGPRGALLDLAGRATHVAFSEPEARITSGIECYERALDRLDDQLDCFSAIAQGPKGCIWMDGDKMQQAKSFTAPLRGRLSKVPPARVQRHRQRRSRDQVSDLRRATGRAGPR